MLAYMNPAPASSTLAVTGVAAKSLMLPINAARRLRLTALFRHHLEGTMIIEQHDRIVRVLDCPSNNCPTKIKQKLSVWESRVCESAVKSGREVDA